MFEKWKSKRPQQTNGEPPLTVLAMTATPADIAPLRLILAGAGWKFHIAADLQESIEYLEAQSASVVLYDRDLPGVDWRQSVRRLASCRCRVILASFVADDYLWEEVIHCGGYDVIPKPFRQAEVIHTIQFAWAALTKSHPSAPHTK